MVQGKGLTRTILDESQDERDIQIAEYYGVDIEEVKKVSLDSPLGPVLWAGEDYEAESYNNLYESFEEPIAAIRAFSNFIISKRAHFARGLEKKLYPLRSRHVLDFGCGVGSHGIHLLESGVAAVDFLDVDGPAIDYAEWQVQRRQLSGSMFLRPDSSLRANKYDAVMCVDVLEHLADPVEAFLKIIGSLKHGGVLVMQYGKNLNPKQGHFKQSRDMWLTDSTRNMINNSLVKLSSFYFRRR